MVNDLADVKSGDVVVPGEQLCVIEELFPSMGTYELDGVVYAATAGSVEMDLKKRTIRVVDKEGRMRIALPQREDEIVGEATNVYDQRAEISIIKINGENVHSPLVGEIHISNVTRRYVKSMRNVVSQGDVVQAHALNTHEIPVELSLVGKEFGVLFSRCVKCGYPLTLTTRNNMICLRCENRETREVAEDYGEKFGLQKRPELAPQRKPYDRRDRGSRRGSRDRRSRRR